MVILGLIAFCAGERTVPAVLEALIIIGYEPVGVFFGVIVCVLLGHFLPPSFYAAVVYNLLIICIKSA